jgi:hypothetical protein
MKEKELAIVVENLGKALEMLQVAGIEDKDIAQKFAVYLVALKLAEKGWEIRVPAEKGKKGRADIYIPYMNVKIEVKSGRRRWDCSCASFGDGNQIKQRKFDYCAFVTLLGNMVNRSIALWHKVLGSLAANRIQNGHSSHLSHEEKASL